ncbi:hypothetical protein L208DRAFT_1465443 [Tricholoma matsutake]|nr:hypothetical protein L208DRAFT_1465443 [Tricholoma matsutake 945]
MTEHAPKPMRAPPGPAPSTQLAPNPPEACCFTKKKKKPAWYTPPASPMMPSTPLAPCSPPHLVPQPPFRPAQLPHHHRCVC